MSAVHATPPEAARAVVICPVLPYPAISGTAKRTLRLLEAMARAGARPHVIASTEHGAGGAHALQARGWAAELAHDPRPGPARRLAQHAARRPSPYLRSVRRRLEDMRGERVAFVQVEHAMSAYYRRAHPSPRTVLSLHNVDSQMLLTVAAAQRRFTPGWARAWNRALATRAVERREAPRADAVLCVSHEDAEHLERLGGRTLVVPNGIDDELLELPDELPAPHRLLFFGHLGYEPNLHGLRRFLGDGGWARVRAGLPGATLRVVGPGLTPALARELAAPGVEAAGVVPDIGAELAASTLVVVPIWQGGGTRLKVLEALAAARPVVSTALGAAGIGFRDGVHGLLADRPDELGDAVLALLRDRGRARALAAGGRRLADGYRWTRMTLPAEQLYERWVRGG